MTDSINASSNSLHARNDADATILYVAISIASNSVMPSFKSCYWVQSCVGCVKNRTGSILELKHHLPCLRCVRCVYSLFACVVFLCCLRCLRSFFNARVCVACVAFICLLLALFYCVACITFLRMSLRCVLRCVRCVGWKPALTNLALLTYFQLHCQGCANRAFYCSSTLSSILSRTRWIMGVAINHRVVQNKRIPGFQFKFVI